MTKTLVVSIVLNIVLITTGMVVVYLAGGIGNVVRKFRQLGQNYHYKYKGTVYDVMPDLKNKTVLLGNSITEGCDWAELFENDNIVNRGIGGDLTSGIVNRIDPILLQQPGKIFLMIGVNDLISGKNTEEILENYKLIITKVSSHPQVKLYVQSILPVSSYIEQKANVTNEKIRKINSQIQALCQSHNVPFVNIYPAFLSEDGTELNEKYSLDGLHLTGEAYLLWKEKIKELVYQ